MEDAGHRPSWYVGLLPMMTGESSCTVTTSSQSPRHPCVSALRPHAFDKRCWKGHPSLPKLAGQVGALYIIGASGPEFIIIGVSGPEFMRIPGIHQ